MVLYLIGYHWHASVQNLLQRVGVNICDPNTLYEALRLQIRERKRRVSPFRAQRSPTNATAPGPAATAGSAPRDFCTAASTAFVVGAAPYSTGNVFCEQLKGWLARKSPLLLKIAEDLLARAVNISGVESREAGLCVRCQLFVYVVEHFPSMPASQRPAPIQNWAEGCSRPVTEFGPGFVYH